MQTIAFFMACVWYLYLTACCQTMESVSMRGLKPNLSVYNGFFFKKYPRYLIYLNALANSKRTRFGHVTAVSAVKKSMITNNDPDDAAMERSVQVEQMPLPSVSTNVHDDLKLMNKPMQMTSSAMNNEVNDGLILNKFVRSENDSGLENGLDERKDVQDNLVEDSSQRKGQEQYLDGTIQTYHSIKRSLMEMIRNSPAEKTDHVTAIDTLMDSSRNVEFPDDKQNVPERVVEQSMHETRPGFLNWFVNANGGQMDWEQDIHPKMKQHQSETDLSDIKRGQHSQHEASVNGNFEEERPQITKESQETPGQSITLRSVAQHKLEAELTSANHQQGGAPVQEIESTIGEHSNITVKLVPAIDTAGLEVIPDQGEDAFVYGRDASKTSQDMKRQPSRLSTGISLMVLKKMMENKDYKQIRSDLHKLG